MFAACTISRPVAIYPELFSFAAETALQRVEQKNLQKVFSVNTFGPILVSKVGELSRPRPSCSSVIASGAAAESTTLYLLQSLLHYPVEWPSHIILLSKIYRLFHLS